MEKITVEELQKKIDSCFELKELHDEKKKEAAKVWGDYTTTYLEVISMMEQLDLDKFSTKKGTFSFKYDESFKTPKTPEDRKAFFDFLKDKGVYDEMVTVNSRTLNSWAKQEVAAAEDEGDFDYQIPGLTKSDPVAKPVLRRQ
jgi:hypothetical protein